MNPRKPTEEEKKELLEYLVSEGFGMGTVTEEQTEGVFNTWMDTAPLAMFDNYQTDYPGYIGKVLVILPTNDLYPEIVEIYVWHEGKITRVRNEEEMGRIVNKNLETRKK
jgi:hypothetical protein